MDIIYSQRDQSRLSQGKPQLYAGIERPGQCDKDRPRSGLPSGNPTAALVEIERSDVRHRAIRVPGEAGITGVDGRASPGQVEVTVVRIYQQGIRIEISIYAVIGEKVIRLFAAIIASKVGYQKRRDLIVEENIVVGAPF